MNGRKRKVQIKFYVTEEERALIEQKMKLVPTQNMAAYLRKISIDGYIIQTDHSDIKAMTAEIQKIGVNINQIAKRVNETGSVYQEDIEEIKGVLAEIWRLDDYEHGIVIRSLNDEKTDLMNQGKSTDAVDDLIIKIGTAPKKKFKVISKDRSDAER